nr:MAG TPA: Oxidoreductase-like protein [Caudoviricetes sp.]
MKNKSDIERLRRLWLLGIYCGNYCAICIWK